MVDPGLVEVFTLLSLGAVSWEHDIVYLHWKKRSSVNTVGDETKCSQFQSCSSCIGDATKTLEH